MSLPFGEPGGRLQIGAVSQVRQEHDNRARANPIGSARNRWRFLPFDDIKRRVKGSIDPSAPWVPVPTAHRRQLEFEWLPISVKNHVKAQFLLRTSRQVPGCGSNYSSPVVPLSRRAR